MRFLLERHTRDSTYCWRVLDTLTQETQGFGLTELHASVLCIYLNTALTVDSSTGSGDRAVGQDDQAGS